MNEITETLHNEAGQVVGEVIRYYDDEGNLVRTRPRKLFPTPGRTSQEFRDQVNINSIAKRVAGARPRPPALAPDQILWADFSAGSDYTEAAERISRMQAAFSALPASVKSLCAQSPAKLLEALGDAERAADLVEAGLETRHLDPSNADEIKAVLDGRKQAAIAAATPPAPPAQPPPAPPAT